DISLGLRQKGVDMRIAVDIASLTLKKQVGTIVLVTGDSDFVPAAKLARREGIEFILDPLWQNVNDDLFEHIDGLQSGIQKPHVAAQV
ncbi:MAG: NYN domain-containing protein, partial [Sheuella sp.]|nr:NYN domain-containing protein [Sheuella sp.]